MLNGTSLLGGDDPVWVAQGPAPSVNGQVEKISPNNEVVGAIHTVVAHPTDPDILYAGAANGGIWKTTDASSSSPHWVPLTDLMPSLSIGAMAMDPFDPQTIVAGIGRYSSFGDFKGLDQVELSSFGGERTGLLITHDGGDSWSTISDTLLLDENFSGVAIQGNVILAASSAGFFNFPTFDGGGLFRSTDGGTTWSSVSDEIDPDTGQLVRESGLDPGSIFDLVADPSQTNRFYVSVGDVGIFQSNNSGASWTNISDSDLGPGGIGEAITTGGVRSNNNTEMAVASDGRLYVAVLENGQAEYIGFTDNQGRVWTAMDLPQTPEFGGTQDFGLNPREKAGAQGATHFSIIADPNDPNTVYVGGDSQDGDIDFPSGNFIGAKDFSGRLFRGDTTIEPSGASPSPQWEHLTHSDSIGAIPEGGTITSSAPHADSREMAFDAAGNLIEVDDGGIYRRTSPEDNRGDWFSIIGDLQVTEFHNIAYDSNSNTIFGGTQDIGTPQQIVSGGSEWEATPVSDLQFVRRLNGDGGDVAVDDTSMPGFSVRYSSAQELGLFRRQVYDTNNIFVSQDFIDINLPGPFQALFTTPVELNRINQERLVVGGSDAIYESLDRGDTFTPVASQGGFVGVAALEYQNAIVYGGMQNGSPAPDVLYVGSGDEVFVRTDADDTLSLTQAQYPGGVIRDIILDPDDWMSAYVIDSRGVFATSNAGVNWSVVTGDLQNLGAGELRSLEYIVGTENDGLVVGTGTGVFVMRDTEIGSWHELGPNLPHAPVMDLDYDSADDVLVAGLLGRGAWTLSQATSGIFGGGDDGGGGEGPSPAPITGAVSGIKWNDMDGDGERDPNEPGLGGFHIFADVNLDGFNNVGELSVITAADGTYTLDGLAPGSYVVREVSAAGFAQTFPGAPLNGHNVNIVADQTVSDINFGNQASRDYDDLPDSYATLDSSGGPSHGVSTGFRLGVLVDGEDDGVPTDDALGDDDAGVSDDDGVLFSSGLAFGETAEVTVFASNNVGYLHGWLDGNGDGDFDDAGEKIIDGVRLTTGTNFVSFMVPNAPARIDEENFSTYARFRYGVEPEIGPGGPALFGEVEGYQVEIPMEPDTGLRAVDDNFEVDEDDVAVSLDVLMNDRLGPGGGTLSVTGVGEFSAGGSATLNGGTSVVYTPAPDFFGSETFVYTVEDGIGGVKQAEVTVNVLSVNDNPTAVNDMFDVPVNSVDFFLDVLQNDEIEPDENETLSIRRITSQPNMGGTVIRINSNTALHYTPAPDFDGVETLEYEVSDGNGGTDTAIVTLNVRPLPPAMQITLDAVDFQGTSIDRVGIGETFYVRAYVEDITSNSGGVFSSYFDLTYTSDDGRVSVETDDVSNSLGFDIEFGPEYGNRQRGTSTPGEIDEVGATDGNAPLGAGQFLLFTVDFTASAAGDVLFETNKADVSGNETTLFGSSSVLPSSQILFGSTMVTVDGFAAVDDFFTGDMAVDAGSTNNILDVLTNDSQEEGGPPLILDSFTDPPNGTASIDGSVIWYTPDGGFSGIDTFMYTIDNGSGDKRDAMVTVEVRDGNNAPDAVDDPNFIVSENSSTMLDVLDNDTDPDSDPLTVTRITAGPDMGGTAVVIGNTPGNMIQYSPMAGFVGTETFEYEITDGNDTDTATVTVKVNPTGGEPDLVRIRVQATDLGGNPISNIEVGQDFLLEMLVTDLRPGPTPPPDGVFSAYVDVDYNPALISTDIIETQLVELTGSPDGGTFTLSFMGESTDPIDYNASAAAVEAALEQLSNLDADDVDVILPGNESWLIQFGTDFTNQDVPELMSNGSGLTGGVNPDVMVSEDGYTIASLVFGPDYQDRPRGSIAGLGELNEVGAARLSLGALGPAERQLFTVRFTADDTGVFDFSGNFADDLSNEVLLISGTSVIPEDRIDFGAPWSLTIDASPSAAAFHNGDMPLDVNDDGRVTLLDAVLVVNKLNSMDNTAVSATASALRATNTAANQADVTYWDTNGDGRLSPFDALLLFTALNEPAIVSASASGVAASIQAASDEPGVSNEADTFSSDLMYAVDAVAPSVGAGAIDFTQPANMLDDRMSRDAELLLVERQSEPDSGGLESIAVTETGSGQDERVPGEETSLEAALTEIAEDIALAWFDDLA